MAEKIHQGFKVNQKKENIPNTIRIQSREGSEKSKQSAKFQNLFYKRTKVHFDTNIEESNFMLSLQDVKLLCKELEKKSEKTEESLKVLIKAFRTDASYVNAFLEEERSLWNLVGYFTGKDSTLQLYATYCITNITSVEHQYSQAVANACSSYLITYLSSEVLLKQDLCATALGNIASDGEKFCELLKAQGVMRPLVNLFKTTSPAVLEAAAFAAIRICAGNEGTINEFLAMGIGELLIKVLKNCKHGSAFGQIAWLLFYLSYSETQLSHLINLGMLDQVFGHLQILSTSISKNVFSLTPLLRITGNAATMVTPELTERLDKMPLDSLIKPFIDCSFVHIIQESLWVMSNIIAIDEKYASKMVNKDMLQSLVRCLNYGECIQKEVMICLCTISSYGSMLLDAVIHHSKVVEHCVCLFSNTNPELVLLAVQLLEMALRMQSIIMFENRDINIESAIESLHDNENKAIMSAAKALSLMYFGHKQKDIDL